MSHRALDLLKEAVKEPKKERIAKWISQLERLIAKYQHRVDGGDKTYKSDVREATAILTNLKAGKFKKVASLIYNFEGYEDLSNDLFNYFEDYRVENIKESIEEIKGDKNMLSQPGFLGKLIKFTQKQEAYFPEIIAAMHDLAHEMQIVSDNKEAWSNFQELMGEALALIYDELEDDIQTVDEM